jgi:hypothetical protein
MVEAKVHLASGILFLFAMSRSFLGHSLIFLFISSSHYLTDTLADIASQTTPLLPPSTSSHRSKTDNDLIQSPPENISHARVRETLPRTLPQN